MPYFPPPRYQRHTLKSGVVSVRIVTAMQIGMRQISAETVEWFGTTFKDGELTRTGRAPSDFPDMSVMCTLRTLGALSLALVMDAKDRRH